MSPSRGPRQRAPRRLQLNRNDTMTGVDQVVWAPGEAMPVGDQRLSAGAWRLPASA